MRLFNPLAALAAITTLTMAQDAPAPPQMTLIYHMEAELGERFSLGSVPTGQERLVIPIVGGTFKGPRISGKVLNLGADWRLTDAQGRLRPDARYNIQTDDGTYIYVQTEGLPPAVDGAPSMLRGRFETDTNGTAAWLNDVAAVGVIRRNGTFSVLIDMWQASGPNEDREPGAKLTNTQASPPSE